MFAWLLMTARQCSTALTCFRDPYGVSVALVSLCGFDSRTMHDDTKVSPIHQNGKKNIVSEDELIGKLLEIFPNMTLGEDNSGQLIVYTDCQLVGGTVVAYEEN